MNCKNCSKPTLNGTLICGSCEDNLQTRPPNKTASKVEPIEESGYRLGPTVIYSFIACCTLHIYFCYLNFPYKRVDIELFWPFDKYAYFENYDFTELAFFIVVPLIILIAANVFSEEKKSDFAGLSKNYDLSYKNNSFPAFFGVFIIAASLCLFLMMFGISPRCDISYINYIRLLLLIILISRIIAIVEIVIVAKKLNRDHNNWGVLSFFVSGTALVIFAHKRKLIY